MKKIKVIVVDDSALMRKIITDMINSERDMEVIDIARNGEDLFEKISVRTPDVITLDIQMPKMDGMMVLKELKKRQINIPVIMLSSVSKKDVEVTMDCLVSGACDFIPKPSGAISLDINKVKDELVEKVRVLYERKIPNRVEEQKKQEGVEQKKPASIQRRRGTSVSKNIEAVVIGASTGGPRALYKVITAFPEKLGVPVFVVQHMPVGFTKAFAERLDNNSKITVVEAAEGDKIQPDVVYIAPGGYHMEVGKDKRIHLNQEPTLWGVRPAVDKLFLSAVQVYGGNLVSVVLTGMGRDGAQGTIEIKRKGGITMAEAESTCTIYGMPKAAFETGMVDEVLPIDDVANEIIKVVGSGE